MCQTIKFANGDTAFICGGHAKAPQYCACGRTASALCDWKVRANESGTCDRPICSDHAKPVANGRKHLCPEHQIAYDSWKKRHPAPQLELFSEGVA